MVKTTGNTGNPAGAPIIKKVETPVGYERETFAAHLPKVSSKTGRADKSAEKEA